MSESDRVQRWREAKRQQGLEAMTIWLSPEEKARLVDMAHHWHRSPSELLREALAQFNPVSPSVTATATDTEQLRALIREEIAASSHVTGTVTDAVTATLEQEVPALVRQIVEEMALEALGFPVTDTSSNVTVAEIQAEDTMAVSTATSTHITVTGNGDVTDMQVSDTEDTPGPTDSLAFDPARHHLGKLCPRGHAWGMTGQSLRTNNKAGYCLKCNAEAAASRRKAQREGT